MTEQATVTFHETQFLIPSSGNWQHVHKSVYHTLLAKKVGGERTFVFACEAFADTQLRVTARGAFRADIPSEGTELTVTQGEEKLISLELAATRRITGKATHINPIPEQEQEDWAKQKLAEAGFDAQSLYIEPREPYPVRKGRNHFSIPVVELTVRGQVADAQRFADAFVQGIGSRKGYGLGMIHDLGGIQ